MNKFELVYNKLFEAYGLQGWWPINNKYSGGPKNFNEQFEVVVGAILTQNCAWSNVEKALINLKGNLDINSILRFDDQKLGQLIRSTGYYNQKVRKLKNVAEFFKNNKDPSREELLSLKGVGPETADSILLYAFNKPYFVVDAYTKRIFIRLKLCDINMSYDELQKLFMDNVDVKLFNDYHALIVKLAKEHCNSKPQCNGCPLNDLCKGLN